MFFGSRIFQKGLSLFGSAVLLLSFLSCKPPQQHDDEIPDNIQGAFLVLNEGLFQNNNSSITYFNWYSHQNSSRLFEQKNGLGLGDTGNDIGIYGEKIYVLMNNSHVMHVLHRRTGKLLEQIHFIENNIGASPRQLTFHEGNVYVSAFNGFLYKLDTTNFNQFEKLQLGVNPDQMLLAGNELWISNSGGLVPEGDSTISVVALSDFSELARIPVGRNPGSMAYDGSSVYVVSRGDYVSIPSRLVKVNSVERTDEKSELLSITGVRYFDGKLYALGYDYNSVVSSLYEIDRTSFSLVSQNLIQNLSIQTLYGFQKLNVLGQSVYALLDAKQFIHQGKVMITDENFQTLFSFTVGLNPTKIVFNEP